MEPPAGNTGQEGEREILGMVMGVQGFSAWLG